MAQTLMILRPSTLRRVLAAATLGVLGIILFWIVLAYPPSHPGWLAFLVLAGGVALWTAWRNWQATALGVELRDDGLFTTDGTELAAAENIRKVDRGFFAFKPSGGFVLILNDPMPRGWQPGVWWRFGRRVGVGGAMPAAGCRAMADAMTAMVAVRRG